MLFLRLQVEDYAFKKWGGPEGLDAEYEKRVHEKQERTEKKFQEKLAGKLNYFFSVTDFNRIEKENENSVVE